MNHKNTSIKPTGLICILVVIQILLSSLQNKTIEYTDIRGKWVNYTNATDSLGNQMMKDGEKLYKKLTFRFNYDIGTIGNEDGVKKEYGMDAVSGHVTFDLSFSNKDDDDEKEMQVKKMYGAFYFNDETLELKIVCGGMKKWDKKTKKFIEYEKSSPVFNEMGQQLNGAKILKVKKNKSITFQWDYDMNGIIETEETMVFTVAKEVE